MQSGLAQKFCYITGSNVNLAIDYCITGIFGGHFDLTDFICVAKLKSRNLISVQHGLVQVSYTTRKA